FADVFIAIGVAFLHARYCRHDLSRRAVAALEGILVDKGLLHRMQLVALREPLDREDLLPLGGERQRQARYYPPAVDQYGAGTALSVVAAFLGGGQTDVLARRLERRGPRGNF